MSGLQPVNAAADRVAGGAGPREVAKKCVPDPREVSWELLHWLWHHGSGKRQRVCRHHAHRPWVEIRKRGDRAGYSGLITCANVWTCPLCSVKIAVERAADIACAIAAHYATGGRVMMLTPTIRHTRSDDLSALLEGLGGAWSACRQHKTPRALWKSHTVGWIKRLEVTVGLNGWHPHLHVLVFLASGVADEQAGELATSIASTWEAKLIRGGFGDLDPEHGVSWKILDLATAQEKVAEYVAKSAALEMASPGTKSGRALSSRTPLQLLADLARDGLAEDAARWREYEAAMHGKQQLRWSDGLRSLLIPELGDEISDQEAAEATDGAGRLLGAIDRETWARVRRSRGGAFKPLAWAELYSDDEQATAYLRAMLAQEGLGELIDLGEIDPGQGGSPVLTELSLDGSRPGTERAAPAPAGPAGSLASRDSCQAGGSPCDRAPVVDPRVHADRGRSVPLVLAAAVALTLPSAP